MCELRTDRGVKNPENVADVIYGRSVPSVGVVEPLVVAPLARPGHLPQVAHAGATGAGALLNQGMIELNS